MTSNEKRRKEKFFEEMQSHSQEIEDKEDIILCSMHEDYDDVDYKAADHLDEVAAIERMRKDK